MDCLMTAGGEYRCWGGEEARSLAGQYCIQWFVWECEAAGGQSRMLHVLRWE